MEISSFIESVRDLSLADANNEIEQICSIPDLLEDITDLDFLINQETNINDNRNEYGDWQTSLSLALSVCNHLKEQGINPTVLFEPTCGKGNFILAALQTFDSIQEVYGIELYKPYIKELQFEILKYSIKNPEKKIKFNLFHQNIFDFDFNLICNNIKKQELLIIGNPPWVTNKKLSEIKSENLPPKSNFKQSKGLEAITGKGNFDISEYICYQIIKAFAGTNSTFSFLVKTSVAKNILYEQKNGRLPIEKMSQHNIDAKMEFNVAVSACLFNISFGNTHTKTCKIYDFYSKLFQKEYGWINGKFVSDIDKYQETSFIDGTSPFKWWSGIKHDCVKVMELQLKNENYINGFGEIVDIEDEVIYPLIKSSDIKASKISSCRKYIIITQHSISENTQEFLEKYPKAATYLLKHADKLDKRGSIIYKNRARFSIFGVGDYSFMKYKVAVSGLYKQAYFSLLLPINNKPILVDDTCYLIGFNNEEDAMITQYILNSSVIQDLIQSLMFLDAKRVINKDLLMRLDLLEAANILSKKDSNILNFNIKDYIQRLNTRKQSGETQLDFID